MPFFHSKPWFKLTGNTLSLEGYVETGGLRLNVGSMGNYKSIKVTTDNVEKLIDWLIKAYPPTLGDTNNVIRLSEVFPLSQATGDSEPGSGDPSK